MDNKNLKIIGIILVALFLCFITKEEQLSCKLNDASCHLIERSIIFKVQFKDKVFQRADVRSCNKLHRKGDAFLSVKTSHGPIWVRSVRVKRHANFDSICGKIISGEEYISPWRLITDK